jgi:hypothetical protein
MAGELRRDSMPLGVCGCPCHIGGPVAHPVPCCTACERCGLAIATGVMHDCLGAFHPRTVAMRGRGLLRALSRLDLMFSAFIVVLVMALAVFSLPLQGSLVLLGAGLVGAASESALSLGRQQSAVRPETSRVMISHPVLPNDALQRTRPAQATEPRR